MTKPPATITHPTSETLRAFGLGHLTGAAYVAVEQHVATCDECCAVLAAIPNDTFIEALQSGQPSHDTRPIATTGSADAKLPSELQVPAELIDHPRYRIIKQLGAGGMGVVYQAEHRIMQRQVALKVIRRDFMRRPQVVERFRREVHAAGRLSHPNIVTSFDAEQAGDLHFLVMEFVDGVDLFRQVERSGPLPIKHACSFIRQAAAGLQHAMEQGMVHRDIKPHNLMLTRDMRIKILDFGLSRFGETNASETDVPATHETDAFASDGLTIVGTAIGTPDYIAPEQIDHSGQCDIRADIYGLGCTFFYLLTGRPPFIDGAVSQRIESHRHQSPPLLASLRPEVPVEIEQIVARMLAKSPGDRFQQPREVADALQAWSRSISSAVAITPRIEPRTSRSPVKRRKAGTVLLGAIALLIVTAVAVAIQWSSSSRNVEVADNKQPSQASAAFIVPVAPSAPAAIVKPVAIEDLRLLIVVPFDDFWYQDFAKVHAAARSRGINRITIASTRVGRCMPGVDTRGPVESVTATLALEQADPEQFDAVVFIGAYPLVSTLLLSDEHHKQVAKSFAERMLAERKLVTGICGGISILAETGILRNRPAA
ncbi:MAG: protein kinase, partial [Planctomycetaceae bacterium]|nr:protein kinase [Planctomycetaceae bacterium]